MPENRLRGCRILVVEDDYFLADALASELAHSGAVVIGPAGAVADALQLIAEQGPIDAAILDVNLNEELAFPVADLLHERGVPFLFTTGYDASVIPRRFSQIARCEKPVQYRRIAQALGRLLDRGPIAR
jgi:DNA-binding NtrC family response regulator